MDRGFNVRVYGISINENDEVLLENGEHKGIRFTKFPGGGLEKGESTIACLIREFKEELDWTIRMVEHFYTTDLYVPSVFNEKEQVISIYYLVKDLAIKNVPNEFFWKSRRALEQDDVTFPIDKKVVELLLEKL